MARPESLGPGCVLGDYLITRTIGAGGMGTVYEASQLSKPGTVALKVLLPQFTSDDSMVQSFVREARIAARMRHPNIVEAYDVAMEDGNLYFVMEYVDGASLREYVASHGPFPPLRALEIVSQVADALSYAWNEKKTIHRDIKPDNVLYAAEGVAKLADLGLATRLSNMRGENSEEEFFGTPQCLAPELYIGKEGSVSSDIYALGITLWFMVTGAFPYEGETPEETLQQHLSKALPRLPEDIDVSEGFYALLENMLAKRPCHRYGSYMELLSDIRLVMEGGMPRMRTSPDSQAPIDMDSASPLQPPVSQIDDDCTREEEKVEAGRGWRLFILNLLLIVAIFAAIAAVFWYVTRTKTAPPEPEERTNSVFMLEPFDKRSEPNILTHT